MDTWISVVRQQMRVQRVTQCELADRIGASQSSVSQWLRERATPSLEVQNRVLKALGMPQLRSANVLRVQEERPLYAASLPTGALPGEGFRYPCLTWRQAAEGAEPSSRRWLFSNYRARGEAYWLPVVGDAMTSPSGWSLAAGMWLLVDPGREHAVGNLVLVWAGPGHGLLCRQWAREGEALYLRPLNAMWPTLPVGPDCEVRGVVVAAIVDFLEGEMH
ncbi:S24 family peptidase [Pseudomonas sp. NPDC007930]|uniref:LexA family protein n=1 Tax=Pseudomonas sp. NPDC007930 TaxID=3364417 RepID=UPI0036E421F3